MDGWTDGRRNGRTEGRTDGWVGSCAGVDACGHASAYAYCLNPRRALHRAQQNSSKRCSYTFSHPADGRASRNLRSNPDTVWRRATASPSQVLKSWTDVLSTKMKVSLRSCHLLEFTDLLSLPDVDSCFCLKEQISTLLASGTNFRSSCIKAEPADTKACVSSRRKV